MVAAIRFTGLRCYHPQPGQTRRSVDTVYAAQRLPNHRLQRAGRDIYLRADGITARPAVPVLLRQSFAQSTKKNSLVMISAWA